MNILNTQKRKFHLPMLRSIKQVNKIEFLTMTQIAINTVYLQRKLNLHVFHKAMSRVAKRNETEACIIRTLYSTI